VQFSFSAGGPNNAADEEEDDPTISSAAAVPMSMPAAFIACVVKYIAPLQNHHFLILFYV
jgi:hypothetical protein